MSRFHIWCITFVPYILKTVYFLTFLLYNELGDKLMSWEYIIIAVALLVIALVAMKVTSRNFDEDMNKLVKYLGGKDNIIDCEVSMSRFKVTLKDVTLANKEGIQKLGAQGIVEIDNQLKIVFGKDARALKKYIKDMR